MALSSSYLVSANRVVEFLQQMKDAQAPERFTQQLLKDWGFSSTNDRAYIPLLKSLGFLTPDGKPTNRYLDYRNHSKSKAVLGAALKDAYSDVFLIKSNPTESDRNAIKGKFKSFHNTSDHVANLMAKTFYTLLENADISAAQKAPEHPNINPLEQPKVEHNSENESKLPPMVNAGGLHYNIQIHLPATKDIEVYNAIFKALRIHLVN